jgi:DNA-binding NarL/FixJ family response regulator
LAACITALASIFATEISTPDDVIEALALLPVLAGLWTLSNPASWQISAFALGLLGLVMVAEPQNRLTILSVGVVGVTLAALLRVYASRLARLLSISSTRSHGPRWSDPMTATLSALEISAGGIASLTRRELEVARLASRGYMAVEIGQLLHISDRTVETHLANAYGKLGVNTRRGLIRISGELLS